MEVTALLLGLAGSLHCVFMCSPLAMAVTGNQHALLRKSLYNGGRILTYGILGAIFTFAGRSINLSGFHFVFTIGVGLTLIMMGVAGLTSIKIPLLTAAMTKFGTQLKTAFSMLLKNKNSVTIFAMGMINGLLPCGLTYLALTYCLTLAGPLDGFNFMLLFGMGTLPAMLGLTTGLSLLLKNLNFNAALVTRYGFVILGVLVLVRLIMTGPHELGHSIEAAGIILCR